MTAFREGSSHSTNTLTAVLVGRRPQRPQRHACPRPWTAAAVRARGCVQEPRLLRGYRRKATAATAAAAVAAAAIGPRPRPGAAVCPCWRRLSRRRRGPILLPPRPWVAVATVSIGRPRPRAGREPMRRRAPLLPIQLHRRRRRRAAHGVLHWTQQHGRQCHDNDPKQQNKMYFLFDAVPIAFE